VLSLLAACALLVSGPAGDPIAAAVSAPRDPSLAEVARVVRETITFHLAPRPRQRAATDDDVAWILARDADDRAHGCGGDAGCLLHADHAGLVVIGRAPARSTGPLAPAGLLAGIVAYGVTLDEWPIIVDGPRSPELAAAVTLAPIAVGALALQRIKADLALVALDE